MLFTIHLLSAATIAGIIESTFDVGSAHLKFFFTHIRAVEIQTNIHI